MPSITYRRQGLKSTKQRKAIGTDETLTQITARLEQIETESEELEEKIEDSRLQFASLDQKLSDIQKEIEAALIRGDREELRRDIGQVKQQLEKINKLQAIAVKEHSDLFKSPFLLRDLLAPVLKTGLEKLNELEAQGKLPNVTIPVLEERLKATSCICGESLDPSDIEGKNRRDHIQCLIDESRRVDAIQGRITDLYF